MGSLQPSFGWLARFRRLARDYERLPQILAGLHFLVFTILMLANASHLFTFPSKCITRSREHHSTTDP